MWHSFSPSAKILTILYLSLALYLQRQMLPPIYQVHLSIFSIVQSPVKLATPSLHLSVQNPGAPSVLSSFVMTAPGIAMHCHFPDELTPVEQCRFKFLLRLGGFVLRMRSLLRN
ncbi:hypothetical protein AVEN_217267-1 [Araneus ventricosus]|uniref:Uncharacterized protein n=1 Tax=Araneus ventricosus TaxID=182803 RepID=A0A4Y2UFR3_ARAVE|nr:hypothetical protein AVEN_95637-1 [Araneus ventricosus]GBO10931.1 hypothetical protein AVEN_159810-1 [Araneus ventricosus]GBO10934.1 hypothetical protein AVEN_14460-1 [Araneus ventricosus]GBO10943.1 hypothetical protein AVEN_216066-1 [Araneus ventricosus]GBO15815.1 hypothetical protein AVEN_50205-1 [Araneus ventricosus]